MERLPFLQDHSLQSLQALYTSLNLVGSSNLGHLESPVLEDLLAPHRLLSWVQFFSYTQYLASPNTY